LEIAIITLPVLRLIDSSPTRHEAPATPEEPSKPAMIPTTKNVIDQFNMLHPSLRLKLSFSRSFTLQLCHGITQRMCQRMNSDENPLA